MIYCTLDESVSAGLRQAPQDSKYALTLGRLELVNHLMSPSLAHVGPRYASQHHVHQRYYIPCLQLERVSWSIQGTRRTSPFIYYGRATALRTKQYHPVHLQTTLVIYTAQQFIYI